MLPASRPLGHHFASAWETHVLPAWCLVAITGFAATSLPGLHECFRSVFSSEGEAATSVVGPVTITVHREHVNERHHFTTLEKESLFANNKRERVAGPPHSLDKARGFIISVGR